MSLADWLPLAISAASLATSVATFVVMRRAHRALEVANAQMDSCLNLLVTRK